MYHALSHEDDFVRLEAEEEKEKLFKAMRFLETVVVRLLTPK